MQILIFFTLFFVGCQSLIYYDLMREEWETFKITYNKQYATEAEEHHRMHIFIENKYKIAKHNKKYAQNLVSFENGINEFSDMSTEEFFNTMLCQMSDMNNVTGYIHYIPYTNVKIPDSIDWRQKGAVTPIKNQKKCGSCWTFSATGSLEGAHFRKTGKLVRLSEQNLIDCTPETDGCDGGSVWAAFDYIKENGGVDTEESYPYEAEDNKGCRYKSENSGATLIGVGMVIDGTEDLLKELVAMRGPISVNMNAELDSLVHFKGSGVYYDPKCTSKMTHGVLVVGYGTTDNGTDYWTIKNSWGASWGDQGFFKLARNRNNHCGINQVAIYPVV